MTTTNHHKRVLFDRMVASGAIVRIVLDARRDGALLPEAMRNDWALHLDYGKALARPIPDLVTDDAGITGTLSFGGVPTPTHIPWEAVYAIVGSNEGRSWEEDVPREAAVAASEVRVKAAARPNHLKLVD